MTKEYSEYLAHHGIKGQKWGKRRFQNEDGSLTEEGKDRYGVADNDGKTGSSVDELHKNQARLTVNTPYKNTNGVVNPTQRQVEKSREQVRTLLKVTAGVAVASLAVYGGLKAYKHLAPLMDRTVRKGTELHRLSTSSGDSFSRPFFSSNSAKDAVKYKGLLGEDRINSIRTANRRDPGIENARKKLYALMGKKYVPEPIKPEVVFDKTGKVQSKIRIAGDRAGKKAYEHLMRNDKEFADAINARGGAGINGIFNINPTDKNESMRNYKLFNQWLVGHDEGQQPLTDKFFNELKKRGYGGVVDVNDRELSGYMSKSAKIIFDTEKIVQTKVDTLTKDDVNKFSKMARKIIQRQKNAEVNREMLGKTAKRLAYTSAGYAGIAGSSLVAGSAADRAIIENYKKEHPNTQLTDREILKNIRG